MIHKYYPDLIFLHILQVNLDIIQPSPAFQLQKITFRISQYCDKNFPTFLVCLIFLVFKFCSHFSLSHIAAEWFGLLSKYLTRIYRLPHVQAITSWSSYFAANWDVVIWSIINPRSPSLSAAGNSPQWQHFPLGVHLLLLIYFSENFTGPWSLFLDQKVQYNSRTFFMFFRCTRISKFRILRSKNSEKRQLIPSNLHVFTMTIINRFSPMIEIFLGHIQCS